MENKGPDYIPIGMNADDELKEMHKDASVPKEKIEDIVKELNVQYQTDNDYGRFAQRLESIRLKYQEDPIFTNKIRDGLLGIGDVNITNYVTKKDTAFEQAVNTVFPEPKPKQD